MLVCVHVSIDQSTYNTEGLVRRIIVSWKGTLRERERKRERRHRRTDAVIEEIPALDTVGFPNTCSPLPIELPATGTPPVV